MDMTKKQMALDYLRKKSLLHMDMIEPIQRRSARIDYVNEDGVILYEENSGLYMISTENLDIVTRFLEQKGKPEGIAVHQKMLFDFFMNQFEYTEQMECVQAVYESKLPLKVDSSLIIQKLTQKDLGFVCKHYHSMDDDHYISKLIEHGVLYGAYVDDKLAGFIGEHAEGSMGLLEVLPEYQHRGIGYTLEAYKINQILSLGQVPFCQVVVGNEPSLALQKKLGMNISKERLYWLF